MAEELSPETKLYVKEEIEKVRKEVKEEVEKVKSKATKTFTTVVVIVGLLTGLGVYGLAVNYIRQKFEEGGSAKLQELVSEASDSLYKINDIRTTAEEELSNMKNFGQLAEKDGYRWVGSIKLVWGKRRSTSSAKQTFDFAPSGKNDDFNFKKDCFIVITSLSGRITFNETKFTLDRHNDYKNENLPISFLAIGN